MKDMFIFSKQFDGDINTKPIEDDNGNTLYRAWNVSRVRDMSGMFFRAELFNKDINDWDTSNVTNMRAMFFKATSFNKNLAFKQVRDKNNNFLYTAWNVGNVIEMGLMFKDAKSFNGEIWNWNISNNLNFEEMFNGAKEFNDFRIGRWKIRNYVNTNNMFLKSGITRNTFIDEKGNNIEPYRRKIARILNMPEEYMVLYIKTLTGRTFVININPFDIIERIKIKIQNADESLTIDRQRLILPDGRQLENEREIIFYEIKNESTIHLVLRIG
jgi:surface protein